MSAAARRTTLHVLEIPLVHPFRTAGGIVEVRTTVLVSVGDGPIGWGEAAPYPGQDEDVRSLIAMARRGGATASLAAALDEASSDLDARREGRPLLEPATTRLPISVAVGIDGAVGRVDALVDDGVRAFKVKVAPGAIRHVARIRERHPDVSLGVDGNASFTALNRLDTGMLADLDLRFAEELFISWTGGAAEAFAEMTDIPLFADESVRSVHDAERVLAFPAVSGITVKPGRLGWSGALSVRDLAVAAGKRWRASGLLETGVGRSYTDLVASTGDEAMSDCAPARMFLGDDIVAPRHAEGYVIVPTGPGSGAEPDPEALERYRVETVEVDVGVSRSEARDRG